MNEQTLCKTYQLAAEQEVEVNQAGRYMYIDTCAGDVSISIDDEAPFVIRSGLEFGPREFKKFRLRSNVGAGGAASVVKIYAGSLYVTSRNPLVYQRAVPTYIVPLSVTIPNTATYAIPNTNLRTGQKTADKQVKVRVQNFSMPSNVDIFLGAKKVANITAATHAHDFETIETSDQIVLRANGAADVGIMVFYELPT